MEGEPSKKRRSVSESESNRLNSTVISTEIDQPRITERQDNLSQTGSTSQPNLASNFQETPLGAGIGTRLAGVRERAQDDRQVKASKNCELLKKELEAWARQVVLAEHPDLDSILKECGRFKNKIKAVTTEAALRKVDYKIIGDTQDLVIRINKIKKVAEKKERLNLANKRNDTVEDAHDIARTGDLDSGASGQPPILSPIPKHASIICSSVGSEGDEDSRIGLVDARSTLSESIDNIITFVNTSRNKLIVNNGTTEQEISQGSESTGSNSVTGLVENLTIQMYNHKKKMDEFEKSGIEMQRQMADIKNDLHRANDRFATVINDTKSIRSQLGELSTRVNSIEESTSEFIRDKIEVVTARMVETGSREIIERIDTQIREAIVKNLPDVMPESIKKQIHEVRRDLEKLKRKEFCNEQMMDSLRNVIVDVKEQVDNSIVENSNNSRPQTHVRNRIHSAQMRNEADIVKGGIERSVKLIAQLISTEIIDTNDLGLIRKCNKEDAQKITKYSRECRDGLLKYVSYPGADNDYCSRVKDLLERADNWTIEMEMLYSQTEAHAITSSKGDTSKLTVFSDNSEKTVYEFFDSLELCLMGWGTGKQRAQELRSLLSEELKDQLEDKLESYSRTKQYLIQLFGSPERIVSEIVAGLASKRKPSYANKKEKYQFYAELTRGVSRLDKLVKIPNIDVNALETVLYSRNTLKSLIGLLPEYDSDQLRREMSSRKMDWSNPQGVATFGLFKETAETERNILEIFKGLDTSISKPKNKTVHATNVGYSSEEEQGAHGTSHPYSPPKPWYAPNARFPCPLDGHKHEMSECVNFLSMTPSERWEKTKKNRICYACLRPKLVCVGRTCTFTATVPETLVCQGCVDFAKLNGWAPFSILMCKKGAHEALRVKYGDVKKQLDKYLGKLHTGINESNLKISANFMYGTHQTSMSCTKITGCNCQEHDSVLNFETPTIDSRTGCRVNPSVDKIIPQIPEHSFYLMQTLKIGGSEVLTFWDRGANANLGEGEFMVKEGLQLVTAKPTELKVVGGGKIKTKYGSYRFNLGPTLAEEYHEIVCMGMESVTTKFRKYELTEIIDEFRATSKGDEKEEILPPSVGGGKVQLLLGIKNTKLDPVLVRILPSGVGVYRSQFTDIYGSNIILAGPHKVFTQGNNTGKNEFTHGVFKTEFVTDTENSTDHADRSYSITVHSDTNSVLYPSPVTEDDFIDIGGEIRNEELDLNCHLSDGYNKDDLGHFCSVHKAFIPISRMRQLVDLDDVGDLLLPKNLTS